MERRQRHMNRMLERMLKGIGWFLDPPTGTQPREDTPPMTTPRVSPERLARLRPAVYAKGWRAYHRRTPREENPYHTTRGGYQNAWFFGWDDGEAGLDRRTPETP